MVVAPASFLLARGLPATHAFDLEVRGKEIGGRIAMRKLVILI